MGMPLAIFAVAMKLLRKLYWSARFERYPLVDDLSISIVDLIRGSHAPKQ
jgi:hypothetical protein